MLYESRVMKRVEIYTVIGYHQHRKIIPLSLSPQPKYVLYCCTHAVRLAHTHMLFRRNYKIKLAWVRNPTTASMAVRPCLSSASR